MEWIALLVAGLFECGWPVGLKLGWSESGALWGWLAFAAMSMAASGALLLIAQQRIPMGTAYAVWTGIGAVGTALLGMALFGESREVARLVCIGLIVAGIVGLKWVTPASH